MELIVPWLQLEDQAVYLAAESCDHLRPWLWWQTASQEFFAKINPMHRWILFLLAVIENHAGAWRL
jgi:hypothetical protein